MHESAYIRAQVDRAEYDGKRHRALTGDVVQDFVVPKRSAKTWVMEKGDLCRVTVVEGSQVNASGGAGRGRRGSLTKVKLSLIHDPHLQVGDMNFWNRDDPAERFYSGKTRQLHSAHLSVYDRLWSALPYLRPMATVVADSLKYGIDEDGAGVHDVIGGAPFLA